MPLLPPLRNWKSPHYQNDSRGWVRGALSMGALSREEVISEFCALYRIPRWRVEAMLATFRHFGPDTWQ
jgi:hypothetical protein